ncbi:MAG: pyruvate kinase [Candidatus Woesearchaeota archaeon]
MKTDVSAIVTIPPYAPFIEEVLRHPVVSGLRLNTVMPLKGTFEENLQRLYDTANSQDKDLWIDLKCRQLRVKNFGVPPFTEIELTHQISVDTPVTAYFSDGREQATVLQVDGNRLIMQEGPKRVIGPGESVNIMHPSLSIEGFFTGTDVQYIEAAKKIGMHKYMLSFVEQVSDVEELLKLDSQAEIVEKIESEKGLNYVCNEWNQKSELKGKTHLMAARGDLYVELSKPHYIIRAIEDIVKADPKAIVASRIFSSLGQGLEPSCADIGDVSNLLRMGYKNLMLGDEVCQRRESVISALNLLYAMVRKG